MVNLKDNYCFNVMKRMGEMYEKMISAHESKKESIIETYGWDSPETHEWYKKYDEMKKNFPFTNGQCKAYRAWCDSIKWEDIIILNDFLWDEEMDDFIQTLKGSGIKEFVYVNTSTAVMDNIHGFIDGGYDFAGLYMISDKDKYGNDWVKGIRFKMSDEN